MEPNYLEVEKTGSQLFLARKTVSELFRVINTVSQLLAIQKKVDPW